MTYAAPSPVAEYIVPAPAESHAAPAPVVELVDQTPAVPVVDVPPEGMERAQPAPVAEAAASCAAPVPVAKKRRRGKVPAATCAAPAVAAPAASEVEAAMQQVSGLLVTGLGEGSPEFDAAAARCIELGAAVMAEHDEKVANLNAEALLLEEDQEARQVAKKQAKRKKR